MFKQRAVVVAVCALALVGCGGGGGGSGGDSAGATESAASDLQLPMRCSALDTTQTTLSGVAPAGASLLAVTRDAAAILAGACLYSEFVAGSGVNQFGGMGATSYDLPPDDIACGVYEPAAGTPSVGSGLATSATATQAVYCTVKLAAEDQGAAGTTHHVHFLKLEPVRTDSTAVQTFNVTSLVGEFLPVGNGYQISVVNPCVAWSETPPACSKRDLLELTATFNLAASGEATSYRLSGRVPTGLDPVTGEQDNLLGALRIELAGSRAQLTAGTPQIVLGFEGTFEAVEQDQTTVTEQRSFDAGTKLGINLTPSGLGDLLLAEVQANN